MYRKFTAQQIFDGQQLLAEKRVLITDQNGVIKDIVPPMDAGDDVQELGGLLCPGFINAHCHLELSHLKGKLPKEIGLTNFVLNIVNNRSAVKEIIFDAIEQADEAMRSAGIVAVGDICNTENTIPLKKKSHLHYHNFIETIGFPEEVASTRFNAAVDLLKAFQSFSSHNSIVPHAPYSVSQQLLKSIAEFSDEDISSIHNQESEEENEFISNKKGPLLELYRQLGVDLSFFQPSGKRSLDYVLPYFNPRRNLLLVHNVITNQSDIDQVKAHFLHTPEQLYFCLCPNANKFISGALPPLDLLIKNNSNIVLGTDSLASNDSLSILAEIQLLQKNFPHVELTEMLRWATYNGAKALKIDNRFGSFEAGKQPGILSVDGSKVKRLI